MLKNFRHVLQLMEEATSLDDALFVVVQHLIKTLEVQACSIFVTEAEDHHFILKAAEGIDSSLIGKMRIAYGKDLIGIVAKNQEPLQIEDAKVDTQFSKPSYLDKGNFRAYLAVPILFQRRSIGVLIVQQEEPRKFDDAEEAFLMTLAAWLAKFIATHAEISLNGKNQSLKSMILTGISASNGIAIGHGALVYSAADLDDIPDCEVDDVDLEIERYQKALEATKIETKILGDRMRSQLSEEEQLLFDVYLKILESEHLNEKVIKKIKQKQWAPGALRRVIHHYASQFEAMDNDYFRERVTDFKDLGRRILKHLQEEKIEEIEYPRQTILIGENVTATQLAEVPEGHLVGIVSIHGSNNSHVSILARSMGIPAVMGVRELPISQLHGKTLIIDGYFGQVHISPDLSLLESYQELQHEEEVLTADLEKLRLLPTETKDGHRIELLINAGLMADMGDALSAHADGIGLYRTEVPFMMRDRFPSVEEQRVIYRQLLTIFSPRPVVIRLLDIGGDKMLPYFQMEQENPSLGWRGIRVLLDHQDIFLNQLRALFKASVGLNNLKIIIPMITSIDELDASLKLIHRVHQEVIQEGVEVAMPEIGAMIEVPSAVYQTEVIARKVSFLSVGTNDLTQYTLAVDRNNEQVASLYDSLHPAIIQSLLNIVTAAQKQNTPVSVCGEMAGDPLSVILLLGMGYGSFSMNVTNLLRVKSVIRQFTLERAKNVLEKVLSCHHASEVRSCLEQALADVGLSELIRLKNR